MSAVKKNFFFLRRYEIPAPFIIFFLRQTTRKVEWDTHEEGKTDMMGFKA
jgi:hypothetical protein